METNSALFVEYFPFLLPLLILQLGLAVFAVIHVIKHPTYRFGNQLMWIMMVLFLQIIGPIVYFAFGRGEK